MNQYDKLHPDYARLLTEMYGKDSLEKLLPSSLSKYADNAISKIYKSLEDLRIKYDTDIEVLKQTRIDEIFGTQA